MSYDYQGHKLPDNDESGYTMETEPSWTASQLLYATKGTSGDAGDVGAADATLAISDYIPVRGKNSLIIMMPWVATAAPPIYGLCFYDADKNPLRRSGTTAYWQRSISDARAKLAEAYVPDGAAFFRTTWWSDSARQSYPSTPDFTYTFTPGRYREFAVTHEIPANRGMLNCVRRVRQLTDIRWAPKVNVPRYCLMQSSSVHYLDWCETDREYIGIPYSGSGQGETWQEGVIDPTTDAGKWGYYQMWVGLEMSPETFVTAARYPNSIFGERSGRSTVNYDASPYGDVCTSLVSYALGLSTPIWSINGYTTSESYGKNWFVSLGKLGVGIQPDEIRMGDVFHNSSHIAIVTDIARDTDGNVVSVEISEATTIGSGKNAADGDLLGGFCRRVSWPVATLVSSYWANEYTMYRFKAFTAIGYTRSRFVDTGGEGDGRPVIDLPCIPYLGNRARYKAGYIRNSKILIGATGFTNLVVKKDGATFGTFPINGATEIEVGFTAVGSYSAYLEKTGAASMSCYWTVE